MRKFIYIFLLQYRTPQPSFGPSRDSSRLLFKPVFSLLTLAFPLILCVNLVLPSSPHFTHSTPVKTRALFFSCVPSGSPRDSCSKPRS